MDGLGMSEPIFREGCSPPSSADSLRAGTKWPPPTMHRTRGLLPVNDQLPYTLRFGRIQALSR